MIGWLRIVSGGRVFGFGCRFSGGSDLESKPLFGGGTVFGSERCSECARSTPGVFGEFGIGPRSRVRDVRDVRDQPRGVLGVRGVRGIDLSVFGEFGIGSRSRVRDVRDVRDRPRVRGVCPPPGTVWGVRYLKAGVLSGCGSGCGPGRCPTPFRPTEGV